MGSGALLECLKVSKKLLQYHYLQSLHSTLLCKVANIEIVLFKIHKYSRNVCIYRQFRSEKLGSCSSVKSRYFHRLEYHYNVYCNNMNRKNVVGLYSFGFFNGFYATGNNSNLFKGENRTKY